MPWADQVLDTIVSWAILLFEYVGVGVIVASGVRGAVCYVRRDPETRLKLAKGLAMGLEFKLGSEILRTVVVRELREIVLVGAIILLRAALTFLIHWEITEMKRGPPGIRPRSPEQAAPRDRRGLLFPFSWCAKRGERKY